MVKGKTVVLGVTGGVAIYKACDIVSRLRKLDVDVKVIMTKGATEFIDKQLFQALSQNYVVADMFEDPKTWDIEHIALAKAADVFVIAPATANIIGKISNGIADDMLSTTVMATTAPVLIAPAMNTNMYNNPIVQGNIERLRGFGYHFVEPDSGRLSCGDIGKGKLASPESVVQHIVEILERNDEKKKTLKGKRFLITAGPTRELIDPVRYITNRSTGKTGYAIACEARDRGAEVVLVTGPTSLKRPSGMEVVEVETALEMYDEVMKRMDKDVIIKTAAVADYRPLDFSDEKIKKSDDDMSIPLTRNHDIAKALGEKKTNQILVGFAAETQNVEENAIKKIKKKNLDFIVANNVKVEGAGFAGNTNVVTIIDKDGTKEPHEMMSKNEVAKVILDKIETKL